MYNDCMPYNYAHAIMAQKARETREKQAQTLLAEQAGYYLLGTMGPDPYFGDALPPPVGRTSQAALADKLHAVSLEQLLAGLLPLSEGDDGLFCYTLGFLCHVLLDNHTHPYIEARFPGKGHTPAEIAMDPILAKRSGDPRYLMPPKAFYGAEEDAIQAIDQLHTKLMWKLFALRTQGAYRNSLKKWLRVCSLQFDPKGVKARLFKLIPGATDYLLTYDKADGQDLLNERHKPWGKQHRAEGETSPSFMDLFDQACREAAECLELAVQLRGTGDYGPLLQRLRGRSADAAESL